MNKFDIQANYKYRATHHFAKKYSGLNVFNFN